MIIEFTLQNFRSFKDEFTLSMEAEGLSSGKDRLIKTSNNTLLLPSAGIFGANASGKSNIFKALSFMLYAMSNTDINKPTVEHPLLLPFELDDSSFKKPIFMQIIFWDQDKEREYRYGFEVNKTQVLEEWLYVKSKVKTKFTSKCIFRRHGQDFESDPDQKSNLKDLTSRVNPQLLALPVFAQFYHLVALDLFQLAKKVDVIDNASLNMHILVEAINIMHEDPNSASEIIDFIKKADVHIQSVKIEKTINSLNKIPADVRANFLKQGVNPNKDVVALQALTQHKTYGEIPGTKDFALYNHESAGTTKIFALAVFLTRAFKQGGVFFIDELDAGLHPLIVQAIINQLNNKDINNKGVQLIYSSHATYLLSSKMNSRRDQIWLVEKNKKEESILKCLSEYRTRKDYEIAKNYLAGRFGAVPILGFTESEPYLE